MPVSALNLSCCDCKSSLKCSCCEALTWHQHHEGPSSLMGTHGGRGEPGDPQGTPNPRVCLFSGPDTRGRGASECVPSPQEMKGGDAGDTQLSLLSLPQPPQRCPGPLSVLQLGPKDAAAPQPAGAAEDWPRQETGGPGPRTSSNPGKDKNVFVPTLCPDLRWVWLTLHHAGMIPNPAPLLCHRPCHNGSENTQGLGGKHPPAAQGLCSPLSPPCPLPFREKLGPKGQGGARCPPSSHLTPSGGWEQPGGAGAPAAPLTRSTTPTATTGRASSSPTATDFANHTGQRRVDISGGSNPPLQADRSKGMVPSGDTGGTHAAGSVLAQTKAGGHEPS